MADKLQRYQKIKDRQDPMINESGDEISKDQALMQQGAIEYLRTPNVYEALKRKLAEGTQAVRTGYENFKNWKPFETDQDRFEQAYREKLAQDAAIEKYIKGE